MPCVCSHLSDDIVGSSIDDVRGLRATLDEIEFVPSAYCAFFRCRACGTIWEEQLTPAMHVDVTVVSKTMVDGAGHGVHVAYNLPVAGSRRV